MVSSKNACEIMLLSFENALFFSTGDFSGVSITLSASFGEHSYGLNTLDNGFSVSTLQINYTYCGLRDVHDAVD